MWKIGDVEIDGQVVLAPMAGITSLGYRSFMKPFGVALSYSEMVSAVGLIYRNEQTIDYLRTSKEDHPVALQLFGADPEKIVQAMKIAEELNDDFELFDLNLGCPVSKVTKAGAGSALLKDPEKLYLYAKTIVEGADKPVTAKIRLGWDENSINFLANIDALERAGIKAIAVHARTKAQGFLGQPDFEIMRDLRSKMSVPLIVSGGIFTLDDALNALEITGADAVMVARGAVGNPFLVKQIDHYLRTGERLPRPDAKENVRYLLEYVDDLIAEKGEEVAVRILRGTATKFLGGYPGLKPLKGRISSTIRTKADLIDILKEGGLI